MRRTALLITLLSLGGLPYAVAAEDPPGAEASGTNDAQPDVALPNPADPRSYPLVPWAGAGDLDAPFIGPIDYPTEGSWAHVRQTPRLLTHGRRTPSWLQWAVKSQEPTFYDANPPPPIDYTVPEAEITARTIPEPPPDPEPFQRNEIVVWGERLERAHQVVAQRLEELGYKMRKSGDGRSVWVTEDQKDRWKPKVTVYDEGWFTVHASAVSFSGTSSGMVPGAPAHGGSPAPSFDRAPAAPAAGVGFAFSTRRQRQAAEARVARLLHEAVRGIAEAQADGRLLARLEELPTELDRMWYGGEAPDGRPLPTIASRQEAILDLWASRTVSRSGETVRLAISDYLLGEIDPEAPLNPALVRRAEERCGCIFPWPWRSRQIEGRGGDGDTADGEPDGS